MCTPRMNDKLALLEVISLLTDLLESHPSSLPISLTFVFWCSVSIVCLFVCRPLVGLWVVVCHKQRRCPLLVSPIFDSSRFASIPTSLLEESGPARLSSHATIKETRHLDSAKGQAIIIISDCERLNLKWRWRK